MSPSRIPEPDPLLEEILILSEEVRILRMAIDELTEAVKWQNNNAEDYPLLVEGRSKLWSLAHLRLPALVEDVVPSEVIPPIPTSNPTEQKKLF